MKSRRSAITVTLGMLGLVLVVLWLLTGSPDMAQAADAIANVAEITVCPTGPPGCDYALIQDAVDAAYDGDVIKVAAGVYSDVNNYGSLSQVVYISKTVIVRGGYTTDFTEPPDPEANPTTLDAEGQGRVLYITGNISPTVEGLRITGGDATGLGGDPLGPAGGGVYIYQASATISTCLVYENTAGRSRDCSGGGLYLYESDATLRDNTVWENTANPSMLGYGGGLCLYRSDATLSGNTVVSNTASAGGSNGYGGGVYLRESHATLSGNVVLSNTASTDDWGYGGGIYLYGSNAVLSDNIVQDNIGSKVIGFGGGLYLWACDVTLDGSSIQGNLAGGSQGFGGGLHLRESTATLRGEIIQDNIASGTGEGTGGGLYVEDSDISLIDSTVQSNIASIDYNGCGGGLYLYDWSNATLSGNMIRDNIASMESDGDGGGICLHSYSSVALTENTVISNVATLSPTTSGRGGGLWLYGSKDFVMTNNILAGNHATSEGSGLWIESWYPNTGRLLHTTIAGGQNSEQGVYVGQKTTLSFTNTIIAGHAGVGVFADTGGTANLDGTLWYDNAADTGGEGIIVTGTINVSGDPVFVDPAEWDYHIGPGSAAINRGIDTGINLDIDGDPRPDWCFFDIGADELLTGKPCHRIYLPLILRNAP